MSRLKTINDLERQLSQEQIQKARIESLKEDRVTEAFLNQGFGYHLSVLLRIYYANLEEAYFENVRRSGK